MQHFTTKSVIFGGIAWFAYVIVLISEASCVRFSSCGGWDVFLLIIIAIGGFAPAYIVALVVNGMSSK